MRSSLCALAAREIGWFLRTRPAHVGWSGGVASFTFDDFPKSALTLGGTILERHGFRGTYYTALQLAGTENRLGPMFDVSDLSAAHHAGHEIACHTLSHLDCRYAATQAIAAEVTENSARVAALLGGIMPTSFAYPYGAVSITAKRVLAHRFATCRGTGEGINRGAVDLADLRVVTLFAGRFDRAALARTIAAAHAANGWVIFYTHDISEQPSEFGCTPEQFEMVVAEAARHLTVLPVRQVAVRFTGAAECATAAPA